MVQQPRIVYVDDLSMESMLNEIWPGITVKLDLFHGMHRSTRLIHDNHCLKWDFALELSACLLIPYDKDLATFYAAQKAQKDKRPDGKAKAGPNHANELGKSGEKILVVPGLPGLSDEGAQKAEQSNGDAKVVWASPGFRKAFAGAGGRW